MTDCETHIESIYQVATLPEQWPKILRQIGGTIGIAPAAPIARRSDSWNG